MSNLDAAFCEKFNLNIDAFQGRRRTSGGILDDYRVSDTCKTIDQISALRVRPSGRFGNNIHQIIHARHIADCLKIQHVDLSLLDLPSWAPSKNTSCQPPPDAHTSHECFLEGDFFYDFTFKKYMTPIAESKMRAISDEILKPVLGISPAMCNSNNEICIHIRSGDLFGDNPNPWYFQPPLSFYKISIYEIFKIYGPKHIVVVYEDRINPIVDRLLEYLEHASFSYSTSSSESLIDDASALIRSQYLIVGKGSFASALALISMKKKCIAYFRNFGNAGHCYNAHASHDFIEVVDTANAYPQRDWSNSPEQRKLLLDYPISNLSCTHNTVQSDLQCDLREIGRHRFEALEAQCIDIDTEQQLSAQSTQAAEAMQARDRQAERVKALEAEKVEAAKTAEKLKQQLAAQSTQAAEAKQARDQQAERVKALEAELAQQTGNLAAMAEALQRLRQLAMPPTS